MKTGSHLFRILSSTVRIALFVGSTNCALADTSDGNLQRNLRYQEDRRTCLNGNSHQYLETCLKEVQAVRADPPSSTAKVSQEELQMNAVMRCEVFTKVDRADCLARMRGEGTVSGSVEGGGIYRERVTVDVFSPPEPVPSARKPK